MEPWSLEWKQQKYKALREDWENCQKCELAEHRKNVVFGDGNLNADILFVGEGPGANEDTKGICFIGPSGELLRTLCRTVGLDWEGVFVTNIVSCQPPENRDPIAKEKDACLPRVHELIYLVDPLLIVPVGKYALNALTSGRVWGIEKEHGELFSSPDPQIQVPGEHNGVVIPGKVFPRKGENKKTHNLDYDLLPILHPAYILRKGGYDPKTMEFSPGGEVHRTLNDLQAIVDKVNQLKREYEIIPRLIERM